MGFVERKLESVVWNTPGLEIQGRLLAVQQVKYSDGVGLKYKVAKSDGTMLIVPGATFLDAKLQPSDIGCNVSIMFTGEDESREITQGRSRPKLFKVLVDESSKVASASVPADGAPAITDEDIPF